MASKGEKLAYKYKNKEYLDTHRNVALERCEHAQADGRTDERQFRKTDGARCRRYDGASGPKSVEKRLLHFAGSISVTVNAPPLPSALNITLSPALIFSSIAGSLT